MLAGAAALGCLSIACGVEETQDAAAASSFKVLVQPAPEPTLPDASIWEVPLGDPELERGRLVWSGTCIECHSTGLGGAPLIGNEALWRPRAEKGIEVLYEHAMQGFYGDAGEMPARGGNAKLTDEEVKLAVRFMVSRIQ